MTVTKKELMERGKRSSAINTIWLACKKEIDFPSDWETLTRPRDIKLCQKEASVILGDRFGVFPDIIAEMVEKMKKDKSLLSMVDFAKAFEDSWKKANDNMVVDASIIAGIMISSTGIGTAVGAIIGTFLFPGFGTAAGAFIGALMGASLGVSITAIQALARGRFMGEINSINQMLIQIGGVGGTLAFFALAGTIIGTIIAPGVGTLVGMGAGFIGPIIGFFSGITASKITGWFSNKNAQPKTDIQAEFKPIENSTSKSPLKLISEKSKELDIASILDTSHDTMRFG